ncbi:MAG: YraN family protein [Candidatus Omnitrophota bacterium]
MSKESLNFGKTAEAIAGVFLKQSGYKILARNYLTRLGEVDIIARDKDVYCFIEVKARRSDCFGVPQEAVSKTKQIQISKAALSYIKEHNLFNEKCRFDVVVVKQEDELMGFEIIKDAFTLDERFTP